MNKDQRGSAVLRFQKINPVALARPVAKVEGLRMPGAHLRREAIPFGNDGRGLGHMQRVVEAEIELLLCQLAPIRCIDRRAHENISGFVVS